MREINEIRRATHVRDHVIFLEFDDGTAGEIDLTPYIERGPIFRPLADLSFFRRFSLEGGTLTWPNGADIAPETLYEMTTSAIKQAERTVLR
jgi:uncharacterized protein DUF2442